MKNLVEIAIGTGTGMLIMTAYLYYNNLASNTYLLCSLIISTNTITAGIVTKIRTY